YRLQTFALFKVDEDYLGKLQDCFGLIRSVNKSDVLTLASNFGSIKAVCDASADELAQCPGLGDKKVARIHEALHEPLIRIHSRSKRKRTDGFLFGSKENVQTCVEDESVQLN
ncbi:unnamed protein product, partial [Hapterophycus canaliculatus]